VNEFAALPFPKQKEHVGLHTHGCSMSVRLRVPPTRLLPSIVRPKVRPPMDCFFSLFPFFFFLGSSTRPLHYSTPLLCLFLHGAMELYDGSLLLLASFSCSCSCHFLFSLKILSYPSILSHPIPSHPIPSLTADGRSNMTFFLFISSYQQDDLC
jgi:hypothetical protein